MDLDHLPKHKHIVLMLGHKARVGKDTLAEMIVNRFYRSQVCHRYGFADKLKDVAKQLYGLNHEQLFGSKKEVPIPHLGGLTPRQILQDLGQSQRAIFDSVWVDVVVRQIETQRQLYGRTISVIADFRFPNEYYRVQAWTEADPMSRLVVPIRIDRPDREQISRSQDISETALDDWNGWAATFVNDSTVEDLYQKFVTFYRSL